MARFENQTAIITGGAQGLGLGIAERMGSEGARIALVDRNEKQLGVAQQTLESKGVTALAITADITDRETVERAVEAAVARFGGVEVLVTAAGITGQTHRKAHERPNEIPRYPAVVPLLLHAVVDIHSAQAVDSRSKPTR